MAENNGAECAVDLGDAPTLPRGTIDSCAPVGRSLCSARWWGAQGCGRVLQCGRVVFWLARSGGHVAMLTYPKYWLERRCATIVPLDRSVRPPRLPPLLQFTMRMAARRTNARERRTDAYAPDRARSPEMSSGGVPCNAAAHGVPFCPRSRRARRAARDPRRPWLAAHPSVFAVGGGRAGAGMEARARARVEGTARNERHGPAPAWDGRQGPGAKRSRDRGGRLQYGQPSREGIRMTQWRWRVAVLCMHRQQGSAGGDGQMAAG